MRTRSPTADPLPELTPGAADARGCSAPGSCATAACSCAASSRATGALSLAAEIDRAFAERERHDAGGSAAPGYYEEFAPREGSGEPVVRSWIKQGGGLLAADAPKLHFEMMELFARRAAARSWSAATSASRR